MIFGLHYNIFITLTQNQDSMKHIHTIILLSAITTLLSCRQHEVEPMIAAGYIEQNPSAESIIIKGDTIGIRHFAIDEQTTFEGGETVVGNIAEIIYMPAEEENELPLALTITTDNTYPKALGRWATEGKVPLQVDIELEPRGRITQHLPQQVLRFTSWQLSGVEDEITLYGTISLPPEVTKAEKAKKPEKSKDEEKPAPPMRRERSFKISATIAKQADSNTESRQVLILHTPSSRESKLYRQE